MDLIKGECYIVNGKIYSCQSIKYQFNNLEYQVYEVLRITNKIPIFLNDHLSRLKESLILLGISDQFDENYAEKIILALIKKNNISIGNLKLLFGYSKDYPKYASYFIPHYYPTENEYKYGIKLTSYSIVRKEPQIKQILINDLIKKEIENTRLITNAYEILLVNEMNCITEGSKSNIFLIKNNTLYSSLEKWILKGITRKYILDIIIKYKLDYIEKVIKKSDLPNFDAAFICGTSPKVLPVKEIDDIFYNTNHSIIQFIKEKYEELIEYQINNI
jgi:branched-chain amino acid aminotransferase